MLLMLLPEAKKYIFRVYFLDAHSVIYAAIVWISHFRFRTDIDTCFSRRTKLIDGNGQQKKRNKIHQVWRQLRQVTRFNCIILLEPLYTKRHLKTDTRGHETVLNKFIMSRAINTYKCHREESNH